MPKYSDDGKVTKFIVHLVFQSDLYVHVSLLFGECKNWTNVIPKRTHVCLCTFRILWNHRHTSCTQHLGDILAGIQVYDCSRCKTVRIGQGWWQDCSRITFLQRLLSIITSSQAWLHFFNNYKYESWSCPLEKVLMIYNDTGISSRVQMMECQRGNSRLWIEKMLFPAFMALRTDSLDKQLHELAQSQSKCEILCAIMKKILDSRTMPKLLPWNASTTIITTTAKKIAVNQHWDHELLLFVPILKEDGLLMALIVRCVIFGWWNSFLTAVLKTLTVNIRRFIFDDHTQGGMKGSLTRAMTIWRGGSWGLINPQ